MSNGQGRNEGSTTPDEENATGKGVALAGGSQPSAMPNRPRPHSGPIRSEVAFVSTDRGHFERVDQAAKHYVDPEYADLDTVDRRLIEFVEMLVLIMIEHINSKGKGLNGGVINKVTFYDDDESGQATEEEPEVDEDEKPGKKSKTPDDDDSGSSSDSSCDDVTSNEGYDLEKGLQQALEDLVGDPEETLQEPTEKEKTPSPQGQSEKEEKRAKKAEKDHEALMNLLAGQRFLAEIDKINFTHGAHKTVIRDIAKVLDHRSQSIEVNEPPVAEGLLRAMMDTIRAATSKDTLLFMLSMC
ncbi:hypothetical protein BDZ85DRAFT_282097 [Elsinoe ampelina]|uniref:Uncharacterized protein n=1 Tax=Elsinoe ampelina TaxID=302913 RepID=A0A6A6GBH0_9PEZI|nr:hypothetical protein BDZ85DRAFT_282097 [Elsinoe ampelina]